MKRFLCLLMVVFIIIGFSGCGKNNSTSPTDNTDITNISDLSSMESSETESSEVTSSADVSTTPDNSDISDESNISAPDDGKIEELEEEITRLNALLIEANSEIETQQNRIKDLEQQLDESNNQIDNSLFKTIHIRGGACLYLYGILNTCKELKIVHADKSVQTIFSNGWMTTIKPSPDGSKVIMNDFEMDYHSQVFIYDVNTRKTEKPLMSDIPAGYTASFMEWLDSRYFLFVVQFDQGTIVRGGDVYVYDTQTDNYRLFIKSEDKSHQICYFDIYPNDLVAFKAMIYDEAYDTYKDVYYSVTINEIYNLINNNKTMTLKAENEIYSPTLETNINIAYASENILRQFKSLDEFTDNCGSESIIFYTYVPVKDFCFIAVNWDESEDEENTFEIRNPIPQDVLYSAEQLVRGIPLMIKNTYINEITRSNRGIKFTDKNNKVRYFYITNSGKDSLTLVEFTNEVLFKRKIRFLPAHFAVTACGSAFIR